MGRFRRVEVRIWRDAKFRGLTDEAKLLWLRLLTDPGLTTYGAIATCWSGLAEDLGWPVKRVSERVSELVSCGMIKACQNAGLIVLWNYVKYNPPANEKMIIGWNASAKEMPECELLSLYLTHVKEIIEQENETKAKPVSIPFADFQDTGIDTGIGTGILQGKGDGKGKGKGKGTVCSEPSDDSSEPAATPDELANLELYATDKKLCLDWPKLMVSWPLAFPGVDILAEIRKAHAWEIANPEKRKRNRKKFLHNWLSRAQDRCGKTVGHNSPAAPDWNAIDYAADTKRQAKETF